MRNILSPGSVRCCCLLLLSIVYMGSFFLSARGCLLLLLAPGPVWAWSKLSRTASVDRNPLYRGGRYRSNSTERIHGRIVDPSGYRYFRNCTISRNPASASRSPVKCPSNAAMITQPMTRLALLSRVGRTPTVGAPDSC